MQSVAERSPGIPDTQVLSRANEINAVLLTADKDFGELAVVRGQAHSGIVRLVGFTSAPQATASVAVFGHYADELSRGAIVTAEPGRTRVRP